MTLGEAVINGRKRGKAVRRSSWPVGVYMYHGMDNLMMLVNGDGDEQTLTPDAATFLAEDWEISDQPYHGKLNTLVSDEQDKAMRADAARYRWLRSRNWSDSRLCVVVNPREAVKPGHDCPSFERLDEAIDIEMASK